MTPEEMWNDETPVSEHGLKVPEWIESDIAANTIAAICHGGCESGAYMPAVTYHQATETMNTHGDEVLEYVVHNWGELPEHTQELSWDGRAVFYLSCAVELWAEQATYELEEVTI